MVRKFFFLKTIPLAILGIFVLVGSSCVKVPALDSHSAVENRSAKHHRQIISWEGVMPEEYIQNKYGSDFVIAENIAGDINNDTLEDRLFILKESDRVDENIPRYSFDDTKSAYPLLVFFKLKNGNYRLKIDSDRVIPPPSFAHNGDHSYDTIVFRNGEFSFDAIDLYGGVSTVKTFHFVYDKDRDSLVLSKVHGITYKNTEDEEGKVMEGVYVGEKRVDIRDFDIISIL